MARRIIIRNPTKMFSQGEKIHLEFVFRIKVVQWTEDLYEKQLIERTTDACGGPVDVVMNFGTNSRSLHRSLQCLAPVCI